MIRIDKFQPGTGYLLFGEEKQKQNTILVQRNVAAVCDIVVTDLLCDIIMGRSVILQSDVCSALFKVSNLNF